MSNLIRLSLKPAKKFYFEKKKRNSTLRSPTQDMRQGDFDTKGLK